MNEKFFDLKKEKQDRMINALLKVFAKCGYKQASTDEMVSVAGISKGLLFHYFGSKIGAYTFVYDYAVKFLQIETESLLDSEKHDFFDLMEEKYHMLQQILMTYPYLTLFLDRCRLEETIEALASTQDQKDALDELEEGFLKQVSQSSLPVGMEAAALENMVDSTAHCYLERVLHEGAFNPDVFLREMNSYISILKMLKKNK